MTRIQLALTLVCAVGALPAMAQDPTKVSPEYYKVEAENERVRVVRMRRGPNQHAPMHEHPNFVVVFLTDVHQKVTPADGTPREVRRKRGEVGFTRAVKHSEETLADHPMESILIELKSDKPIGGPPLALDTVKVDPKHHTVLLENELVRVVRSYREPHAKLPMHEHPMYVAIAMTDGTARTTLADGTTGETRRKAGSVSLRPPVKHAVEDLGDQPREEIAVELK